VNYNKVILGGRLVRDIELKNTSSGVSVATVGLAVNRRSKGRDGEAKEEVLFVDCTAFGKTAEVMAQHLSKGREVLIEGRLKLDQWESDGQRRSKLSVVVEEFQFVGPREESAAPAPKAAPPRASPRTQAALTRTQPIEMDDSDPPF